MVAPRSVAFSLAVAVAGALSLAAPPARLEAAAGDPYRVHALVGARVVVSPDVVLGRATIVVRDGIIEAVGPEVTVPADARVFDLAGKTVYPGLIDAYIPAAMLSATAKPVKPVTGDEETAAPAKEEHPAGAGHALSWVHPEHSVARTLTLNPEAVAKYRDLGFVAAQVVPDAGIFRGRSAVIALGDEPVNRLVYRDFAANVVALELQKGEYPNALMGVIALLRQTFLDARWYREAQALWSHHPAGRERPETNLAWEALAAAAAGGEPVLVDALADPHNVLRASTFGRELGLDLTVVATGGEYRRLAEVAATKLPLIVPLDFPEAPLVGDDPAEWTLVATDTLRHWKNAPANPRWLDRAGVRFALTAAKLGESPAPFTEKLRAAVEAGLPRERALAALTTVPAEMLGAGRLLGTIEKGKVASFVVTDGDLFDEDTGVHAVWVDGRRYEPRTRRTVKPIDEPKGAWALALTEGGVRRENAIEFSRDGGEWKGKWLELTGALAGKVYDLRCVEIKDGRIVAELAHLGNALLVADYTNDSLAGTLELAGGPTRVVSGQRLTGGRLDRKRRPPAPAKPPDPAGGPLAAPAAVVVRNATIWTAGPQGTLAGADLLVEGGKVTAVGRGLTAPGSALVIDGTGKHLTPGLIDAHSHTAISSGINEGTRSVTAEVRIGDVINSEDWNIYSELAGGLTTALLLHGSANAIGGQSQTIKLRWGAAPEALKLEGAMPGIKFALGENVKQSNWGERFTTRYPQTRLGVEQVMRERFLAARDYLRAWDEHREKRRSDPDAIPPRRDLQLDTMVEILRGERLVHCHSYRQDEILMLIRLAEEFGIRIGTFQHGLETYKVADEVAAHGAGASIFSDWWAFKFEVYDAIPYAGALLWDRGVVVSFNSDSNEQARRLNSEAAKAMKYGGIPADEAIKFVTLNPALQLRVDRRIGSLEPGKDADFVLWNGPPLSSLSLALETWIEGRKYFDRAADLARRAEVDGARAGLVAAARAALQEKRPEPRAGGGHRPQLEVEEEGSSRCLDGTTGEAR
jgi:imidazolonepropionase-like amidohydrolase